MENISSFYPGMLHMFSQFASRLYISMPTAFFLRPLVVLLDPRVRAKMQIMKISARSRNGEHAARNIIENVKRILFNPGSKSTIYCDLVPFFNSILLEGVNAMYVLGDHRCGRDVKRNQFNVFRLPLRGKYISSKDGSFRSEYV